MITRLNVNCFHQVYEDTSTSESQMKMIRSLLASQASNNFAEEAPMERISRALEVVSLP